MIESFLTGIGLSGSAGLNAYLPLIILGIAGRADVVTLQNPYSYLSDPLVLGILFVLLLMEMTADKLPAVDSLNDGIHTFIRPAAGMFLSAASTAGIHEDSSAMLTVVSILAGGLSAGGVHLIKAFVRPGVTVSTGGLGNVLVSILEDLISITVSVIAIFIPFLVVFFSLSVVSLWGWWQWDTRRTSRYFPSAKQKRSNWA